MSTCLICYENVSDAAVEQQEVIRIDPCNHTFCRDCLREYVTHIVQFQQVQYFPINCPCAAEHNCKATVTNDQAKSLFQDESNTLIKYERLQQRYNDPNLHVCPFCSELSPSKINDTTCIHCDKGFCTVHGSAHESVPCAEYQIRQDCAETRLLLKSLDVKPCSHCGSHIMRNGGCAHIICPACHKDFCFTCGTHEYLTGKVVRNCKNCRQGFVDHRYAFEYRMRLLLYLPLLLPSFFIYVAVSLGFAATTVFFCCCFGCGYCFLDNQDDDDEDVDTDASNVFHGERTIAPRKGIRRALILIFLPFMILLHEFGYTVKEVEDIFSGHDREPQVKTSQTVTSTDEETGIFTI